MSDADHATDALATDAVPADAILVDAIAIDSEPTHAADTVTAESHAITTDALELPPIAANAVADTVEGAFNTKPAGTVPVATNRCVEPKQPVVGSQHE